MLETTNLDPRAKLPARAGVGFKAQHFQSLMEDSKGVSWFEVHPENYMGEGGMPHAMLTKLRERFPISLHGVGLSIGAEKPLDKAHLARFKALIDRYQPALCSEHLAWSTHETHFLNDLLPVPYTDETLQRVVDHVDQVQTAFGRQILIENPSTYIVFEQSTMLEVDFMREIAKRSGCGLLFDVNNVFVSATNHGYSPEDYIDAYPLDIVQEIHLAGHAEDEDDAGEPLLIDAHDRNVDNRVWTLYERVLMQTGALPSLVEWDNDVPEWDILALEADKAQSMLKQYPAKILGTAIAYA